MTPSRYERIKDIFVAATALPMKDRRDYIEGACGGDEALRVEVERMIAVDDATAGGATIYRDGDTRSVAVHTRGATPALEIPGYEIIGELHRGGQGVVYEATQLSTKRVVAIKVLLAGPFASVAAKKRFEREIELVAQLNHPNIIAIFHSGETTTGQRYYVMDLVRGSSLLQHARRRKLSLEAILELFATVCDAVQFAHQRGVIHRDLKPSNILVDADGSPKVLDFGLAKVAESPAESMVSLTNQVMGTLAYMSPEQARGNPNDIDTRTDVYSLGVILYELQTGHFPYSVVGQLTDVLRNICDTAPVPPERKWSPPLGAPAVGTRRGAGACPIDDEVRTILLKALSKERERRYQSPGELARDIRHYLSGAPIEAKRDSGWYVLRKSLRRHRVALGVSCAFVMLLLGATVVSTTYWRLAEERLGEADAVTSFLTDTIALADPDTSFRKFNEPNGDLKFAEVLDASSQQIAGSFDGQPRVEARIRNTLGEAFYRTAQYQQAIEHLERAAEIYRSSDPARAAACLKRLGNIYYNQENDDTAEDYYIRALQQLRDNHDDDDHHEIAQVLNDIGLITLRRRELDESERFFREALDIREKLPDTRPDLIAESLINLAFVEQFRINNEKAIELATSAFDRVEEAYGLHDSETIQTLWLLGRIQAACGKLQDARVNLERAEGAARQLFSNPHMLMDGLLYMLGSVYYQLKEYDRAASAFEESLQLREHLYDKNHPIVATCLDYLARVRSRQDECEGAIDLMTRAIRIRKTSLEPDHVRTLKSTDMLGVILKRCDQYQQAEEAFLEAAAGFERIGDRERLAKSYRATGECRLALGQNRKAELALLRAREVFSELDKEDPFTLKLLIKLYGAWKKPAEESQYQELLAQASDGKNQ